MWVGYFIGISKFNVQKIFVLFYGFVLNGRLSIRALTFGMTNSFKYENFFVVAVSVRSISI